jgi:gluconokinase
MPSYLIGLDIGTTSTKALAFDGQGQVLAWAKVGYPTEFSGQHWATQNPQHIWLAVQQSLQEMAAQLPPNYTPAVGGISSAMHSLLPLNEDFQPLDRLMLWSDNRAQEVVKSFLDKNEDPFYASVGVPLHPMTPLAKLHWARVTGAAWFEKARYFVGIKEWIWYQLTGHLEMDLSMASATGMLDLARRQWHVSCLDWLGLSVDRLPPLCDTTTQRPLRAKGLLPLGTPWVIGASDGCLANLGAGAIKLGDLAVTLGTSAAVRSAVSVPILDPQKRTFCYYLDAQRYIVGGGSNSGGLVIEWFVRQFAQGDFALFWAWVSASKSDGLVFLPYLQGERAPLWDASAVGVFHGLGLQHGLPQMARALVEGIIFNLKKIIDVLTKIQEIKYKKIILGGGLAEQPFLAQLMADILGIPVQCTDSTEHSAWGAALLAQQAMGWVSFSVDPVSPQICWPSQADGHYEGKFAQFDALVENKPWLLT